MATEDKKMKQRRGTAANWTSANPILAAGEIGFETDTGKFKIGNGSSTWTALTYYFVTTPFTVASATGPASLDFHEDTDNGTNKVTLAAPSSLSADRSIVFPDESGTLATQAYANSLIAGLSWKQAVRVATTAAGTLSTSFENGDTVDGVVLATGDRILIKNQASATENGIYTVNASGAPTRATDADSGAELVNASVYVSEGTTNADKQFVCTTNATITIGATNITFTEFSSGGGISGSTGATDNRLLRADGTGGATVQNSLIAVDDNGGYAVTLGNAATVGLAITGAASQTGNIHEYTSNGGSAGDKYRLTKDGYIILENGGAYGFQYRGDGIWANNVADWAFQFDLGNGRMLFPRNPALMWDYKDGIGGYSVGLKSAGSGISVDSDAGRGTLLIVTNTSNDGGSMAFGSLRPSQITSNQNNYNRASDSGKSKFLYLNTDASRDITGLNIGQVDGQEHVIINNGSFNIVLKHQDTNSTTTNRFLNSTAADITLSPDQAADLIYDGTAGRWRVFKRN